LINIFDSKSLLLELVLVLKRRFRKDKKFLQMALEFTDNNFEDKVLNSGSVTVVDFWAQWCGPCRAIAPIIEELADQYAGTALIGKVDVDANQELAMQYSIRSIPTILILKDGEVVEKHVGAITKAVLQAKLDKHLA
jgi:thioredoxin 1